MKYTKNGYWIFLYYPDDDFLMMLFRGVRKGFWPHGTPIEEAAINSLSEDGMKSMRDKDWKSFYVDTDFTKDWKVAWGTAATHFNTTSGLYWL